MISINMRRRTMRLGAFLFIFISTGTITLMRVNAKPAGIYEEISLPEEIFGVKKREDSSRVYLEQCGIVEFPNARRGVVNVLAFLDSSWPYSHRQAIMLEMLSSRLRKSGLTEILFFVVNVSPYFPRKIDTTEDDIEREAWLGVSPDEIAGFAKMNKTLDSLARIMDADIKLIQDNEELGIWKLLGGSRDQVLVIDRCGKLTYQVIVPWSILHFPYVKAAILSTYNDQPCEACDSIEEDILEETSESTRTMGSFAEAVTVESSTETESLFAENLMSTSIFSQNSDRAIVADSTTRNPVDENVNVRTESPGNNEETTTETPKIQDDVTTIFPEVESSGSDDDPSGISTSTFNYESTIFEENPHLPATEMTIGLFDFDSDNENYDTTSFDAVTSLGSTMGNVDNTTTEVNLVSTEVARFDDESATETETLTRNSVTNFDAGDESSSTTSNFEATEANEEVVSTTENFSETSTSAILSAEEKYQRSNDSSPRLESSKENEANGLDGSYVPIRIIMHAPHFHVDSDSTRMHEYLVMKTGSSETHGHLASQDATRLYHGPQDHQETRMEDSAAEAIERKAWSMKNLIFTKDESTGLFGEVADYWRDLSSLENYDDLEETERPENQRIYYDEVIKEPTNEKLWDESETSNNENWKSSTESLAAEAASEIITEVQPITRTEEFDSEEDETRNKLIAHYSKLLPWIYYVLHK